MTVIRGFRGGFMNMEIGSQVCGNDNDFMHSSSVDNNEDADKPFI